MKPKLKPPGTRRLKLKHEELLSNFGFKFNLRSYIPETMPRLLKTILDIVRAKH